VRAYDSGLEVRLTAAEREALPWSQAGHLLAVESGQVSETLPFQEISPTASAGTSY
jgi:hypothetical protein